MPTDSEKLVAYLFERKLLEDFCEWLYENQYLDDEVTSDHWGRLNELISDPKGVVNCFLKELIRRDEYSDRARMGR